MEVKKIDIPEEERKKLLNAYRKLLRDCRKDIDKEQKKLIRKAFNFAMEAHADVRRKSGELYIFHPLEVANICAKEMGLGTTAVVCSLLHDVVEDTDYTLDDIKQVFGEKVAEIINGLTKISGVVHKSKSLQAENFKKILLTIADDVRVILIKLSDRLHNMRTLDAMKHDKQLKISSETLEIYAPLAHRLGLYSIKSELEDLSLKFTAPEVFNDINRRLDRTKIRRNKYIKNFIKPLEQDLAKLGHPYSIKARTKSIYSIYQKMLKKDIPFEQVYDIFAIRIIIDVPMDIEKASCWRVYSFVTDNYRPNPSRIRDWISIPKANGYESLHTTVMGEGGKWVEVQIRSKRMDELAEKGYAAHWKYKEGDVNAEQGLDNWISSIRDMLENPNNNAIDFFDDFKLNLFNEEVFVFTPKGDLIALPKKSTALDFAFKIHTDIGLKCLGAKVNNKLVPLDYTLKSGDQVDVIISNKQRPSRDWLNYVVTARAITKIKGFIKDVERQDIEKGKEQLLRKLKVNNAKEGKHLLEKVAHYLKVENSQKLFIQVANNLINRTKVNKAVLEALKNAKTNGKKQLDKQVAAIKKDKKLKTESLLAKKKITIGGENDFDFSFASCCNPIPGDDIFGFISIGGGVKIHRTNCPNGINLMSKYGYRIIDAEWLEQKDSSPSSFMAGIKIMGIDGMGVVNDITGAISKQLKVDIVSITVKANKGAFEGAIVMKITDTLHLEQLIKRMKQIEGIDNVVRFNVKEAANLEH